MMVERKDFMEENECVCPHCGLSGFKKAVEDSDDYSNVFYKMSDKIMEKEGNWGCSDASIHGEPVVELFACPKCRKTFIELK